MPILHKVRPFHICMELSFTNVAVFDTDCWTINKYLRLQYWEGKYLHVEFFSIYTSFSKTLQKVITTNFFFKTANENRLTHFYVLDDRYDIVE